MSSFSLPLRSPSRHLLTPPPWHHSYQPHLTRTYHSTSPSLARRTSPPHPGTPSFRLSPTERAPERLARKRAQGVKKDAELGKYDFQLGIDTQILRRTGIAGKFTHAKSIPARHRKHEEELIENARRAKRDESHVDFYEAREIAQYDQTKLAEDRWVVGMDTPDEQKYEAWRFPDKEWNTKTPKHVGTYGQEPSPVYTFEQREAFGVLRQAALMNEERRAIRKKWDAMSPENRQAWQKNMTDGGQTLVEPGEEGYWSPTYDNAGLRHPLYDFIRDGLAIDVRHAADIQATPWTEDQLHQKSFKDLHTLWYVVLKERNIILTEIAEMNRTLGEYLQPGAPLIDNLYTRRTVCNTSLRNIKSVLTSRRSSMLSLASRLSPTSEDPSQSLTAQQWLLAIQIESNRLAVAACSPYASNPSLIDQQSPAPMLTSESETERDARREKWLVSFRDSERARVAEELKGTKEGQGRVRQMLVEREVPEDEVELCMKDLRSVVKMESGSGFLMGEQAADGTEARA